MRRALCRPEWPPPLDTLSPYRPRAPAPILTEATRAACRRKDSYFECGVSGDTGCATSGDSEVVWAGKGAFYGACQSSTYSAGWVGVQKDGDQKAYSYNSGRRCLVEANLATMSDPIPSERRQRRRASEPNEEAPLSGPLRRVTETGSHKWANVTGSYRRRRMSSPSEVGMRLRIEREYRFTVLYAEGESDKASLGGPLGWSAFAPLYNYEYGWNKVIRIEWGTDSYLQFKSPYANPFVAQPASVDAGATFTSTTPWASGYPLLNIPRAITVSTQGAALFDLTEFHTSDTKLHEEVLKAGGAVLAISPQGATRCAWAIKPRCGPSIFLARKRERCMLAWGSLTHSRARPRRWVRLVITCARWPRLSQDRHQLRFHPNPLRGRLRP